jgi:hypothetical protein
MLMLRVQQLAEMVVIGKANDGSGAREEELGSKSRARFVVAFRSGRFLSPLLGPDTPRLPSTWLLCKIHNMHFYTTIHTHNHSLDSMLDKTCANGVA